MRACWFCSIISSLMLIACSYQPEIAKTGCDLDFKYGVIKWAKVPTIVNVDSSGNLDNSRFLTNKDVQSTIGLLDQANPRGFLREVETSLENIEKYGNIYVINHCSWGGDNDLCTNYIGNWDGARDVHLSSHPYNTSKIIPHFVKTPIMGLNTSLNIKRRPLSLNGGAGNIQGYFVFDSFDRIQNVVCFVYGGVSESIYGKIISECLTRSLGLYEVSSKIAGGINSMKRPEHFIPHDEESEKNLRACLQIIDGV